VNEHQDRSPGLGLNELLLGAVITLIVAGVLFGASLYVLPGEHLELPELQPVVSVARESDFPVGASRLVRWGERPVLVVRTEESRYFALEGASPSDGCLLDWEQDASRIVSPCTYIVYDLRGNVVTGVSRSPLARYPVFVRDGIVYVAES
jgi:nitrite reductase/ring-hydroxylating ferredoxin subunit